MGGRIVALAHADARFGVAAALEQAGNPRLGDDVGEAAGVGRIGVPIEAHTDTAFDVLIDFTTAAGSMRWLEHCRANKRAIVMGTTGHDADQLARIREAATVIPIVKAANMSVGVNLLFRLVGEVARTLGDAYDIEIVETHHRFKQDAPSGTALALLDSIVAATGRDRAADVIHGREGLSAGRPARQVGMHALRVGDTVGEHEVHFGTLGETVVLRHSAHTRDTFVAGALRAAEWLMGKPAGLYSMQDVLGLNR